MFLCFLVSNDGNASENSNSQNISYDVSKLIDFPGFNMPAPHRMRDVSYIEEPSPGISVTLLFVSVFCLCFILSQHWNNNTIAFNGDDYTLKF